MSIEDLFEGESRLAEREKTEYDKVLQKILKRVREKAARKSNTEKFIEQRFFGLHFQGYDENRCIQYILDKLRNEHFLAEYIPETGCFFISWEHYVPAFKRQFILRETGIIIDEFGRFVRNTRDEDPEAVKRREEQHAQQMLELRKRSLEDAQFRQLQQRSIYGGRVLDSLRSVYSRDNGGSTKRSRISDEGR